MGGTAQVGPRGGSRSVTTPAVEFGNSLEELLDLIAFDGPQD
jgi:hypothetical protein